VEHGAITKEYRENNKSLRAFSVFSVFLFFILGVVPLGLYHCLANPAGQKRFPVDEDLTEMTEVSTPFCLSRFSFLFRIIVEVLFLSILN